VQCVEARTARLRGRWNARERFGRSVGRTDCAAREHPHAAHERELLVTLDRENFDAVASLAKQHHGRRGTRHYGLFAFVGHGYSTTTERIDSPRFIISKPAPI
jgi:hypothetical protein